MEAKRRKIGESNLGKVSAINLQKMYKVEEVECDTFSGPLLIVAMEMEDKESFVKLVEKGFHKGEYHENYSPLSYAVMRGLHLDTIKKLIENIGDVEKIFSTPDFEDEEGTEYDDEDIWISPLAAAVMTRRDDVLDVLLELVNESNISKIDVIVTERRETILQVVERQNRKDDNLYLKLFQKGFVKIRNISQNMKCTSPILYAIKNNLGISLIQKLIDLGFQIFGGNICKCRFNCNHENPLVYSLEYGETEVFDLLLRYIERK